MVVTHVVNDNEVIRVVCRGIDHLPGRIICTPTNDSIVQRYPSTEETQVNICNTELIYKV